MIDNNWGDKFSHRPMQDLARFVTTYNGATQTVAVDGSHDYSIQTAAAAPAMINGIYIPTLTADAELVIAVDTPHPTATTESWPLLADAQTSFVADDEVYTGTLAGIDQKFYKCLSAHVGMGRDLYKPEDRPDLWQAIPNADGLILDDDETCWVMITAESSEGTLGQLGIWIASTELGTSTAEPTNGLRVPFFDPAYYVVVAFALLTQNYNDCDDGEIGAALEEDYGIDWTAGRDAAYTIVLGPVFPHPDNLPNN